MSVFRVVVAGRPNVGKSALFNRLLRRRRSLVHDLPGMTRDVLEVDAPLPDGRTYRLFDTGGFDPEGKEKIPAAVRDKALAAIRRADLVLLVMDASAGVLPGDRAAAKAARHAGVETLVVANKVDRREGSEGEPEAWELGFAEVYGVSAEHGIGVDELVEAIAARAPKAEPETPSTDAGREIALAVVGRPNVGKSSLVNALLGEERAIVSEIPGTTRDSSDVALTRGDHLFRLVDTAGIRSKARTQRGPEVLSVVQARKRVEECDVALLVLDASEGPTAQDHVRGGPRRPEVAEGAAHRRAAAGVAAVHRSVAAGAHHGYIYVREEYPLAYERMLTAIDQARERGILGEKVMDHDFAFDLKVVRGVFARLLSGVHHARIAYPASTLAPMEAEALRI